ncbi:tyrosine-type recombinase/integrase [Microbacterium sp. PA5]|uniref:tyrosine-type recombinase/integrase n=1 Tax=Microbacterium sp. PA5 TaxID=3416654 RepID=UPI003CF73830
MGEVFERYQALILSRVSQGTGRAYLAAWRTRVRGTFAERDIAGITPLDVEAAFAAWSGSRSTRVDALACLSAICRVAQKGGLIAVNPCVGVEIPRAREYDPGSRALNLDEVRRFLEVVETFPAPYRRFLLAKLYTGCRFGEVAGLRVADIDLAGRTIRVARTASPGITGQLNVGPTKGRRSRKVPIPAPLLPVLAEAVEGKGQHDLLFPGPRGGFLNSKNLSRALDWARVRSDIKVFPPGEAPLHFHDLRHTAADVLFQAGVSAPDVQAILGHSNLAVTQLYADTRAEAARRGAEALSNFYGAQSKGQLGGGEAPAMTGSDSPE